MEINSDNKFETVGLTKVKEVLKKGVNSLDNLINFKTTLAESLEKDVNKLILSDRSMSCILDNFTKSCTANNIELTPFDQLLEAENKVDLDSNNDFIKICKFMYQMVMNKNKETNMKESVEFVLGKVGYYYFSNFYGWLAKIEHFKNYITNIQDINCNDDDFNSFKKLIQSHKLKYHQRSHLKEAYGIFCNNSIPKGERINLKMLGELEENSWLLIVLDIVTCIGFILSAFFAINYFWLGFIEMSSAAAIASMAIPGAVGLLCLGTCIFLLMTQKSRSTEIPYQIGDIKLESGEIVNRYGEEYPKNNIETNLNDSIENNTLQ